MPEPPTQALTLAAPAKINLFLHVTGQRADGYHLLESIFVPIALADTIHLQARADGRIELLDPPQGLSTETDLGCRAARLLQQATGVSEGLSLRIEKNIPFGAGLGGGSSNAATVLLGLNRLWQLELEPTELARIGLQLGADVPFFLGSGPAFVEGIGERLTPVSLPRLEFVLAHPGPAALTREVFQHPLTRRDSAAGPRTSWRPGWGGNDLEAAALALVPAMAELRAAMQALQLEPRMSGSGSALWALTANRDAAQQAAEALRQSGWMAWATHSLQALPGRSLRVDRTGTL